MTTMPSTGPADHLRQGSGGQEAGHYVRRKGGSWLLEDTPAADVFTPERLTDEHRLMGEMDKDQREEHQQIWEHVKTLRRRVASLN